MRIHIHMPVHTLILYLYLYQYLYLYIYAYKYTHMCVRASLGACLHATYVFEFQQNCTISNINAALSRDQFNRYCFRLEKVCTNCRIFTIITLYVVTVVMLPYIQHFIRHKGNIINMFMSYFKTNRMITI